MSNFSYDLAECEERDFIAEYGEMGGDDRDDCADETGEETLEQWEIDGDSREEWAMEYMDGDFDSGMASAGHGTNEDYGYFGGEE